MKEEASEIEGEGRQEVPSPAEHSALMEAGGLQGTIAADLTTNIRFIRTHLKVTLWLLLVVLLLRLLPAPLIIRTFDNDPAALTRHPCSEDTCADGQEGFEAITIKKINPLQRELKYFARLNQEKLGELREALGRGSFDLNQEITWVEIFASRNNEQYGEVIYEKAGSDAYEVLFNNEPLLYIGEVHILSEVSYLIRIYKRIHKYTTRTLTESNSTQSNSTQPQEEKEEDKEVEREISVPLTVELVRYSQFFTGTELLIRYVTFLFILYVRAETAKCPKLFQAIIFFTANPLIFTEIAFPNTASNILSSMCSSTYIFYIPLFLYYTHRPHPSPKADLALRALKLLGSLGLYAASVVRSLHLVNQTFVETVQYLLIVAVLVPIAKYLWRIYFVRSKVVLHRNMLFVVLTLYYFSLLFFSGYVVEYGWKKISFYLIIQAYGVSLCYLTTPRPQEPPPPSPAAQPLSLHSHSAAEAESAAREEEELMEEQFVRVK